MEKDSWLTSDDYFLTIDANCISNYTIVSVSVCSKHTKNINHYINQRVIITFRYILFCTFLPHYICKYYMDVMRSFKSIEHHRVVIFNQVISQWYHYTCASRGVCPNLLKLVSETLKWSHLCVFIKIFKKIGDIIKISRNLLQYCYSDFERNRILTI